MLALPGMTATALLGCLAAASVDCLLINTTVQQDLVSQSAIGAVLASLKR